MSDSTPEESAEEHGQSALWKWLLIAIVLGGLGFLAASLLGEGDGGIQGYEGFN